MGGRRFARRLQGQVQIIICIGIAMLCLVPDVRGAAFAYRDYGAGPDGKGIGPATPVPGGSTLRQAEMS